MIDWHFLFATPSQLGEKKKHDVMFCGSLRVSVFVFLLAWPLSGERVVKRNEL